MNKAKHLLFAAGLSLAVSLFSCSTELAESSPPSSDSHSSSSGSDGSSGMFTDDRDGQTYKWVKIGSQTWMAENLNYDASGSVCYDNSSSNCRTYGRLYQWATAMGVCPDGWHLPSDAEWDKLVNFAGGQNIAGTKLKAAGGWNYTGDLIFICTDEFGFSALPGGYGGSSSGFYEVGFRGNWWTATQNNAGEVYVRHMYYTGDFVNRRNDGQNLRYSVRCVQD